LILVALLGCTPEQPRGGSSTEPPADVKATAVEFRWSARLAYAIVVEPCDYAPDLKRTGVLASEIRDLAVLERNGLPKNLQSQLQIARADAAYAVTVTPRDCSPELLALLSPAKTRIEMDRTDLRELLARMRALAPALASEPGNSISPTSQHDAEFRYLARQVTSALSPLCPISRKGDRFNTLAESRDLVARLRDRIRPTHLEAQFATAEADLLFEHSIFVPECLAPDDPTTPDRIRNTTAQVKIAVHRMEEIAATEVDQRL
jgi:hypothetical protein